MHERRTIPFSKRARRSLRRLFVRKRFRADPLFQAVQFAGSLQLLPGCIISVLRLAKFHPVSLTTWRTTFRYAAPISMRNLQPEQRLIERSHANSAVGAPVEMLLSCTWLAIVVLLILRATSQQKFLPSLLVASAPPAAMAPRVAVIVPARNEERNIDACLRSLISQTYPEDRWAVLVVNDQSVDSTLEIASSFARKTVQVEVVSSPPLPPGWMGKSHACHVGAALTPAGTEWLCFLDADMHAKPALLASALEAAVIEKIDLLSLMPRHELVSCAERLILPCGMYLLSFFQDLGRAQAPESGDTAVTGQFMLLRRSAYDAVGGHAAVRGKICEDLELARLIKGANYRVLLKRADRLLLTRMYTGLETLWPGLAKNLVETFGGAWPTAAVALFAVTFSLTAVLLPISGAITCMDGSKVACASAVIASAGSLTAVAFHVLGAAHFGIPFWYGLLFPLGYITGAVLAFDSIIRRMRGRVSWKGRTYR
jgi:chlorobactene glucosyltransferase